MNYAGICPSTLNTRTAVPKASFLSATQKVASKESGARKILKLAKIISEWGVILSRHFQYDKYIFFEKGVQFFGTGKRAMILPKIPHTAHDFTVAIRAIKENPSSLAKWNLIRKTLKVLSDSTTVYALLAKSYKAVCYSCVILLASDVMDLKKELDKLSKATEGLDLLRIDQKKPIPIETARYSLLRLVKLTMSITSGIIVLLGIALETVLVQPITLLVLSTINVTFSLASKLYKEMMTHNLIANQNEINLAIS